MNESSDIHKEDEDMQYIQDKIECTAIFFYGLTKGSNSNTLYMNQYAIEWATKLACLRSQNLRNPLWKVAQDALAIIGNVTPKTLQGAKEIDGRSYNAVIKRQVKKVQNYIEFSTRTFNGDVYKFMKPRL